MRREFLVLALLSLLLAPALASGHDGGPHGAGGKGTGAGNATAAEEAKRPGPWPPPPANASAANASMPAAPKPEAPATAYEPTVPSPGLRGWAGFKADPERTGFTVARAPRAPVVRWSTTTEGKLPAVGGAVVAHNLVAFAGLDQHARAVDLATGFPQWATPVPGRVAATPAVVDDRVVVATANGTVLALALRDGKVAWEQALGGRITGAPLAAQGFLFVAAQDGVVTALEAHTGILRWTRQVGPLEDLVAPAWAQGRVVVGDGAGKVHALHPLTGAVLWSTDVGAPVTATPVAAGNRVVVPTLGLKALDAEGGRLLWGQPAGTFVRSSPAYGVGVLVWGDPDTPGLAAANVLTGERLWHAPSRSDVRAPPAIAGDVALGAGRDGTVMAVVLRNGTQLWTQDVGERVDAPLAVLDARMVVSRRDGVVRLYADPAAPEALDTTAAVPTGAGSNGFVGLLPVLAVLAAPYVALRVARDRMRRQAEAELVARGARGGEAGAGIRPSRAGPVVVGCPGCACRFGVEPRQDSVVACPACDRRFALRRRAGEPREPGP